MHGVKLTPITPLGLADGKREFAARGAGRSPPP